MSDAKNSMEINVFLQHNDHDTPNTILIRELYDALNGGASTGEALFRILSDSPTWHVCQGFPEGGTYHGLYDIFLSEDSFYRRLATVLYDLQGKPEVFIDGGDVVVALGHYCFRDKIDGPTRKVRFSHTWKITPEKRVDGVWQVCDSY